MSIKTGNTKIRTLGRKHTNWKSCHSVTLFSISDEYFCPQSYFLDLRGTNEGLGRYIWRTCFGTMSGCVAGGRRFERFRGLIGIFRITSGEMFGHRTAKAVTLRCQKRRGDLSSHSFSPSPPALWHSFASREPRLWGVGRVPIPI